VAEDCTWAYCHWMSLLKRRGQGNGREGFVKVGMGREEGQPLVGCCLSPIFFPGGLVGRTNLGSSILWMG